MKNYIQEPHSSDVQALLSRESIVGTDLLCKAEVAAALAKAVRLQYISPSAVRSIWQDFSTDWMTLIRLEPTEALLEQAAQLAMAHGLRGYDAVHLATALAWQQQRGENVTLATFDRQLWTVGRTVEVTV